MPQRIKLRRSLYIGLGGTGMKAILQTKRMFMETYGEIPPMIGFLGIDTEKNAYNKELPSKMGPIGLTKNEGSSISVEAPRAYYENHKASLIWLHHRNVQNILSLHNGAGQIRTNGRLAAVKNLTSLQNSIRISLANIRNHEIIENDKYELIETTKDDIHLIFSVCGGTGCGTFLDIAYLIRDVADQGQIDTEVNIFGYAVLPGIFMTMRHAAGSMHSVKSNAYAAIYDLDYFMHYDPLKIYPPLRHPNKDIPIKDIPFSAIKFIDNVQSGNVTYNNPDQLAEMIALTLFTSAGTIAGAVEGVNDNVIQMITNGDFNVANKRAWIQSIGACEIIIKRNELSEMYALKAAINIIQRLNNATEDANNNANSWIDNSDIKIRENNGHDDLIDQIANEDPGELGTTDAETVDTAISIYYEREIHKSSVYNQKETEILKKKKIQIKEITNEGIEKTRIIEGIIDHLHYFVLSLMNRGEGSITNTIKTLENITQQIDTFMGEMSEEIERYNRLLTDAKGKVENAKVDLKEESAKRSFFNRKKVLISDAINELNISTKLVAQYENGINRRKTAKTIYTELMKQIKIELNVINTIKRTLENIETQLSIKIIEIQNFVKDESAVFQINLSKYYKITTDNNDILLNEFIATLNNRNLYEIGDSTEATAALLNFTQNLPKAKKSLSLNIEEVLDSLSQEEFESLIEKAIDKSKPLLRINTQERSCNSGVPLNDAITKYFYLGLPDDKHSRFTRDDTFNKKLSQNTPVNSIPTGRTDSIIIYRQEGIVPAYALRYINSYRDAYETVRHFPHFDAVYYEKMKSENHQIDPDPDYEEKLT